MIGFWRQLVFLLWKNILVKWRQKFWLSVEILLPLVLFILLALVRLQDFTEESQLCHYDSKALPSAGILPFIESLSCSIMNDCRSEPTTGEKIVVYGNSSNKENPLIVDVFHLVSMQLTEIGKNTSHLEEILSKLAESIIILSEYNYTELESLPLTEISKLNENELTDLLYSMNASQNASRILATATIRPDFLFKIAGKSKQMLKIMTTCNEMNCVGKLMGICDLQDFQQNFVTSEQISQEDLDSLCRLKPSLYLMPFISIAGVRSWTPRMLRITKLFEAFLQLNTSMTWARQQPLRRLEKWTEKLRSEDDLNKALMCGNDPQKLIKESSKIEKKKADTPMNRLLKRLYNFITKIQTKTGRVDVVKKCGNVTFRGFSTFFSRPKSLFIGERDDEKESSGSTCPFLDIPLYGEKTKPLLKGYILVTPDTPMTRRLVKKLEKPFQILDILLKAMPHFADELKQLQTRLHASDARARLQKLLKVVDENAFIRDNLPEDFLIWYSFLEKIYSHPDDPTSPSALFTKFVEKLPKDESCFTLDRFRFVVDENELEKTAVCLQDEQRYLTGLVFNLTTPTISYKIRHPMKMIDNTFRWKQRRWEWMKRDRPLEDLKYLTFGFVFLQEAVDRALIEEMTGKILPALGVHAQQFPSPCYWADTFVVANFYMLCVILSFIVPSALLVKNIVLEKEQKLKEQMRIMGLGDAVHFISWALVAIVGCLLTVLLIAFISRGANVLVRTEIFVLIFWLALYALSCMMLSLFISTWFTNANKAVAMSTIITFVFMFPAIFSRRFDSKYFTRASLILPQSALIYSGWIIGFADMSNGVNWTNWLDQEDDTRNIYLWHCLAALFGDAILYWAWYTSAIFPGTFGISKPWYFPFTRSYWCHTNCRLETGGEESIESKSSSSSQLDSEGFVAETSSSYQATVRIERLSKEYNDGTIALDGLSLKLFENQITTLLGHNGAGKTTMMAMLCGLYESSSGTVNVYGRQELRGIREVLGFCPQQNVLFPLLTVHEQLRFFAALKGMSTDKLDEAADEILIAINLTEKADSLAKNLSGGQKRRLCIGIALIGGSKFVILDEPSAGVDVNHRKDIWRLLQENKKGRTILLSTHHMDEADLLSDRVAVLSEGRLVSCGSPVFLKRNFGQNMQMIACKTEKETDYVEAIRRVEEESPLRGEIKLRDANDAELVFLIPVGVDSQQLEQFFVWFETQKAEMKISDYGITAPSLQDIFIRLTSKKDYKVAKRTRWWQKCCRRTEQKTESEIEERSHSINSSQPSIETRDYEFDVFDQVTGFRRLVTHIRALLSVKTKYIRRNFNMVFLQIILPLLLLFSVEMYSKWKLKGPLISVYEAPPALPLTTRLASRYPDVFFSQITMEGQLQLDVMSQMVDGAGLGATCAWNLPQWEELAADIKCHNDSRGTWSWLKRTNKTEMAPNCVCGTKAHWNCTVENYPLEKENLHVVLNSSDRVWDLTGRNLSQLLLASYSTERNYSAEAIDFMGGFSALHNLRAFSLEQKDEVIRSWRWLRQLAKKWNISEPNPGANFTQGFDFWTSTESLLMSLEIRDNLRIWFNNKFWPALPVYQNVLSNALLKKMSSNKTTSAILTIQHPMKQAACEQFDESQQALHVMFRILLILLVLCTIPAGFSAFLVEDRVSGSYHMQLISGLSKQMYWLTTYFFDLVLYLAGVAVLLLIYYLFEVGEFCHTTRTLLSFLAIFSLYGCSAVLWSYIVQRWFSVSSLAFVLISVGTFFIGSVTSLLIFFIEMLIDKSPSMELVHRICSTVFLLLPQYNLGMAISRGSLSYLVAYRGKTFLKETNRLDLADQLPIPIELEWDLMGSHLLYLALHVLLAALVFFLLEHETFSYLQKIEQIRATAEKSNEELEEDEDVLAEKMRVARLDNGSCPLIVDSLLKRFKKTGLAVKGVTFAVEGGECFGLLGLNGAGKTTCFNILTGKIYASGGTVRIGDVLVERNRTTAFSQVGYCPQFDALNVHLTTRENLTLFARIRALPESSIRPLTDRLLKALHLYPYATTRTGYLSGGNKRKLSVAIALISQPSLILLDEPSAGMDPGSQQFLWRVIKELRKTGKAIVITSHSMEECEALCTRIAIMDHGYLRCLGSKQHLKNKFGNGYSLTLKLASSVSSDSYEDDVDKINRLVQKQLPQAILKAVHCVTLFYKIRKEENLSVGMIFKAVNKIKEKIRIEDFSLSQATLDDVFSQLEKDSGD